MPVTPTILCTPIFKVAQPLITHSADLELDSGEWVSCGPGQGLGSGYLIRPGALITCFRVLSAACRAERIRKRKGGSPAT